MIPFYAVEKEIRLPSGKIVTIKRAGVGYYFRLIYLFAELNELVQARFQLQNLNGKENYNSCKERLCI